MAARCHAPVLESGRRGGVAQLGERRVRNAEVVSSILILSTTESSALWNPISPLAGQLWDTQIASSSKRTDSAGRTSFQVKIRRAGHPVLSRTFPTRRLAHQWAAAKTACTTAG